MIQQASIKPLLSAANDQSGIGASNERIVIIIEKGKVVWFDTTGKLPPGNG